MPINSVSKKLPSLFIFLPPSTRIGKEAAENYIYRSVLRSMGERVDLSLFLIIFYDVRLLGRSRQIP